MHVHVNQAVNQYIYTWIYRACAYARAQPEATPCAVVQLATSAIRQPDQLYRARDVAIYVCTEL